jgi:hypothetical protein
MQGNPYSSTEPGLGPLMRDIKNKICQDVSQSIDLIRQFIIFDYILLLSV